MNYRLILTTCPSLEVAQQLAERLVSERLAACVNILPGAISIYEWQGQMENSAEWVLLIKSRIDLLEELETSLLAHHPYELPEFIVVPIETGHIPYLQWVDSQLDKKK